jgi:hypothetical protein
MQDWKFTFGRFSLIAARLEHHLRATRAAASPHCPAHYRTVDRRLSESASRPGPATRSEQGCADRPGGLAVMAILKLVPTAFN